MKSPIRKCLEELEALPVKGNEMITEETFRVEICGGRTEDIENFIEDTTGEGIIWFDCQLPLRAIDKPFSCKLEKADLGMLFERAHSNRVTIQRREV